MGRCGCEGTCSCSLSSEASFLTITGTGTASDPFVFDTGLDGAWTAWTPTYANLTVGNGTTTGAYVRIGRVIHFYLKFVMGSTSSMGAGPTFTLPATAAARYASTLTDWLGQVAILDSGTAQFGGICPWASSTTASLAAWTASGAYIQQAGFTSTIPMTWTTSDAFTVWGTYEAAT